jgi:hypothetical protein
MHFSRPIGDTIAIVTEGGPGRSVFLDPPLYKSTCCAIVGDTDQDIRAA